MADRDDGRSRGDPMLAIKDLHVYYGESHAIQGVELSLPRGILSVVGRNGMGKTTLCNSIMGMTESRRGSIKFRGREIRGRSPNVIANLGIGYVPQGRRIWPSLTVDEHLRLAARNAGDGAWNLERIYDTFPRLAERRSNGGAQLSGGEQQMLAISRALLANPHLLIMDEPTEGLAPVIVRQVEDMLVEIAADGDFAVLLVEQNIGVATKVAEEVAIMVNGRINRLMPAAELAADRELQQRLLGVGRHSDDAPAGEADEAPPARQENTRHYAARSATPPSTNNAPGSTSSRGIGTPNRWQTDFQSVGYSVRRKPAEAQPTSAKPISFRQPAKVADSYGKTALIAGTFDTKSVELNFIRDQLRAQGVATRTVDLSTTASSGRADVTAIEVASCYSGGSGAVFTGDRGKSVQAMSEAFAVWLVRQRDIGGVISAGGSGGSTLTAKGFQALPVGVPKIIVSTVASGNVAPYVGPADIMMMYAVTDVQGINQVSRNILRNAANALAGMIKGLPTREQRQAELRSSLPALGITMFGLTTPCVQAVCKQLDTDFDCLVFHATGTGGQAMEKLVDGGEIIGVLDLTTTELADMHAGGVFPCDDERMSSIIRTRVPYVGSTGALDMVNFGAMNTVPASYRQRKFVVHNPNVTLMRTNIDECRWLGEWIASRLNQMQGPVRFLLPEGGMSGLDAPGQAFHDPAANNALYEAIESNTQTGPNRKVVRVDAHINEARFVAEAVSSLREICQSTYQSRSA